MVAFTSFVILYSYVLPFGIVKAGDYNDDEDNHVGILLTAIFIYLLVSMCICCPELLL